MQWSFSFRWVGWVWLSGGLRRLKCLRRRLNRILQFQFNIPTRLAVLCETLLEYRALSTWKITPVKIALRLLPDFEVARFVLKIPCRPPKISGVFQTSIINNASWKK